MKKREKLLKQVEKLAKAKINDSVRLAFLKEEELGKIDGLDLSAMTEFKRGSNGTVEIKCIDRLAALEWLIEREGEEPKAQWLYQALEQGAREAGEGE